MNVLSINITLGLTMEYCVHAVYIDVVFLGILEDEKDISFEGCLLNGNLHIVCF